MFSFLVREFFLLINLGTHAVQSIRINSSFNELSVEYAEGSNTRGVLILLLFLTSGERRVDFRKSTSVALIRGHSTLPFPIPNNHYFVLGYDILSDGLLQTGIGYPANRGDVYLLGNNIGNSSWSWCIIDYEVNVS